MRDIVSLNLGTAGEPGVPLAVAPPVAERADGGDQPEKGAGQNNPHCVLHSLDVRVAFRVLLDVHLSHIRQLHAQGEEERGLEGSHASKQAEQGNPEDEEYHVPYPDDRKSDDERDKVEDRRHGRDATDNHGVDL